MLSSILRDVPRPLVELNPRLPREFTRIVRRCLAKDPDERYQSAKDLRLDLEDLRQELSSSEQTPATAAGTAPPPAAALAAVAAGVALAGAAGALAAWLWAARRRRRAGAASCSAHIDRITGEPGVEGRAEPVARRPMGRLQPRGRRHDRTSTCRRSAATGR